MTAVVLDRPASVPQAPADELVVVVTQADIDNGDQGADNWCAIALAARRTRVGGYWSMSIDGELRYLPKLNHWPPEYWHSVEAGQFAEAFDKDRSSVHPEAFHFRRKRPAA